MVTGSAVAAANAAAATTVEDAAGGIDFTLEDKTGLFQVPSGSLLSRVLVGCTVCTLVFSFGDSGNCVLFMLRSCAGSPWSRVFPPCFTAAVGVVQ